MLKHLTNYTNRMQETKDKLLPGAMRFGLVLGGYWVFKYLFFMLGVFIPFLSVIYWGLSLVVPFLAYMLTKRYRDEIGGRIGFLHAWQFGILLYFFAATVVSLVHFVFYQYVADPNMLSDTIEQTARLLKEMNAGEEMIQSVRQINLTPIHMAIQGIFNNVFYGIILSVPVAGLLSKS